LFQSCGCFAKVVREDRQAALFGQSAVSPPCRTLAYCFVQNCPGYPWNSGSLIVKADEFLGSRLVNETVIYAVYFCWKVKQWGCQLMICKNKI